VKKGDKHGNNITDHPNTFARRRITDMAVQFWLGLLSLIITLNMCFPAKPLFGAVLWAFFKRRHRKQGQYLQAKTGMAEDILRDQQSCFLNHRSEIPGKW